MELASYGLDDEEFFSELDVKIIAVDRPGYGDSSPAYGGSILDFGSDIAQLADKLGLEKFSVMGFREGGCYAFAMSHAFYDMSDNRLDKIAVISSAFPRNQSDRPKTWRWMVPSFVEKIRYSVLRYILYNYPEKYESMYAVDDNVRKAPPPSDDCHFCLSFIFRSN